MSRILSFIFLVAVTPLLPAFFFFIGIQTGYIDHYGIVEYFNVIFVDKISWIAYWVSGLFFALLFMLPYKRLAGTVLIGFTVASMSMLLPKFSHDVAYKMFAKKPFHIKVKRWTYKGILLYEGREHYYLLSDDNNRTMTFKKDEIDEAY